MSLDLFRLDGRVALVTGGNRGLGQGIALALARAGADVAVTSRSGAADETLAAIAAAGRRGVVLQADVSQSDTLPALVGRTVAALGGLHILVNNAGTLRRAPALDASWEDWQAVVRVNLDAVWALTQAAGRHMAAQRGGKVISVASMLSFQGGLRVPAYAATKHAVVGLTKALANEWAPLGVNVNAVAPGYFATEITADLRADPERSRQIAERIPAGRWGRPDDLAGALIFLASAASDYVHGHTLAVDGGWLAR